MMIEFVCSPLPPVKLEWGSDPVPRVGELLSWRMPSGFTQGRYRVDSLEWQVYGAIWLRITISPT